MNKLSPAKPVHSNQQGDEAKKLRRVAFIIQKPTTKLFQNTLPSEALGKGKRSALICKWCCPFKQRPLLLSNKLWPPRWEHSQASLTNSTIPGELDIIYQPIFVNSNQLQAQNCQNILIQISSTITLISKVSLWMRTNKNTQKQEECWEISKKFSLTATAGIDTLIFLFKQLQLSLLVTTV